MPAFPNETPQDRAARNRLLQSELELRRKMETVAVELRALPDGGSVPEDYVFERIGPDGDAEQVRFSKLFGKSDTLMVYHMMLPRDSRDGRNGPLGGAFAKVPLADGPCPSCAALLDMWDGTMPHFEGLGGNLVIVAKAPAAQLAGFAAEKGWKNMRLVSAAQSSFRRDYHIEGDDGEAMMVSRCRS